MREAARMGGLTIIRFVDAQLRMKFLTTLLVAGIAAALIAATGALAGAPAKPRLTLVRSQPLTVRGRGFHGHERVRVVVRAASRPAVVQRLRAGRRGRFTTTFGGVALDRCGGISVTAIGRAGSRATLKRPPLPACMPVRTE
jgi:hypothetical protein